MLRREAVDVNVQDAAIAIRVVVTTNAINGNGQHDEHAGVVFASDWLDDCMLLLMSVQRVVHGRDGHNDTLQTRSGLCKTLHATVVCARHRERARATPSICTPKKMSDRLDITVPDHALHQAVAQYLYESNLHGSLAAFVAESKLVTAPLTALAWSAGDVREGRWDAVAAAVVGQLCPRDVAFDVFEHICWELGPVHSAELQAQAPVLQAMKLAHPARFSGLAKPPANLAQLRETLATKVEALHNAHPAMRPKRLVGLVHDAMRFKRLQVGSDVLAQTTDPLALFAAVEQAALDKHVFPTRQLGRAKVVKGVRAECAGFSPDGASLAMGTSDGFVELFTSKSLKRRNDLAYQAESPLLVAAAALCLAFDAASAHLVVGDAKGDVTVFNVADGTIARVLRGAHARSVLCVAVEGTRLLTGGVDGLGKVFGLVSGAVQCELRGHASYVNACALASDRKCVTGGQEGVVRGWHAGTGECLFKIDLREPVLRVISTRPLLPADADGAGAVAVFNRGDATTAVACTAHAVSTIDIATCRVIGDVKITDTELVDCAVSRSGRELIGVTASGALLCWDGGKLVRRMGELAAVDAAKDKVLQVLQHPSECAVAVLSASQLRAFE